MARGARSWGTDLQAATGLLRAEAERLSRELARKKVVMKRISAKAEKPGGGESEAGLTDEIEALKHELDGLEQRVRSSIIRRRDADLYLYLYLYVVACCYRCAATSSAAATPTGS